VARTGTAGLSNRHITHDVAHTRGLGAHELIIDLQAHATRPDELVDTALELAAGATTPSSPRVTDVRRPGGYSPRLAGSTPARVNRSTMWNSPVP
jgi:hypothetical protein